MLSACGIIMSNFKTKGDGGRLNNLRSNNSVKSIDYQEQKGNQDEGRVYRVLFKQSDNELGARNVINNLTARQSGVRKWGDSPESSEQEGNIIYVVVD